MYSFPIPSLALKLKGLIHPGMAPLSWKPNSSPISYLHDQIAASRFSSKLQIKKIIGSNSSHFVYCPSRALSLSRYLAQNVYHTDDVLFLLQPPLPQIWLTQLFFPFFYLLPTIIPSSLLYNTAVFPSKFSFWLHNLVDIKHSLIY